VPVATAASSPSIAFAAASNAVLQNYAHAQTSASPAINTTPSAPPPQMIVGVTSTTSASGLITWVITYANGATQTMTSSGPMPPSTHSYLV
jgi:hypothetical protein